MAARVDPNLGHALGLSFGSKLALAAKHAPDVYLEAQGEEPWDLQRQILKTLWEQREVYVVSGHGLGKSWTASRAVAAWVAAYWPDVLAVILTPSDDQLRAGLWRELIPLADRWHGLPGRPGLNSWSVEGHGVIALGRAPRPEKPGTLQGLHSANLLLVIEEAAEVDDRLWDAADSLLTGENTRLLVIGNPTSDTGEFRRRSTGSTLPGVVTITASCFASPNLQGIDPDSPTLTEDLTARMALPSVHPGLVDARYCLSILSQNDPRKWKTRVLAQFPDSDPDAMIPRSWIERARIEDRERALRIGSTKIEAGVDVARLGADRSVLMPRTGGIVHPPLVWSGYDLMQSTGKIAAWCREFAPSQVWIDEGMGIGIVDRLAEQGFPARAFRHSEAVRNKIDFDDRRTEYWWALRAVFEQNEIDLSQLPEDDFRTLAEELASVRYNYTSAGKRKIERKEQTKERLKRSPDLADALVYAGWSAGAPVYVGTW